LSFFNRRQFHVRRIGVERVDLKAILKA
jgi:hypothetical protein